jgi:hypothetical protein
MANETCPVCGCFVASGGYEIGSAVFCCELCAEDGPCGCGCGGEDQKYENYGRESMMSRSANS